MTALAPNPPATGRVSAAVVDYRLPEYLAARRAAQKLDRRTQSIAIGLAILCTFGAGLLVPGINAIRKERQLVINPETVQGIPADLALLGKLGTFRALVIDWAAIRAERLKEEGKTYEALQLHEMVCALAPRYPKVWANAAWNMAYNISVSQYTPEARWKWVKNGITILRDKGIPFNPKSVTLYKELQWIFWHKIGDFLDDEHLNYKRAWAVEMERVLGPPPVTLSERDYLDWFKKIVDAPRDLNRLLDTDVEVARAASLLRGVALEPDETLLEFVARRLRPERGIDALQKEKQSGDSRTTNRLAVLTDPALRGPLDRLLAAVRSQVLRERYHMDPDWMYNLMVEQYGPLDWRNAFSHSLYWASLGDKLSRGVSVVDLNDQLNNARFIFFALHSLILKGRITLWPDFDDPFSSYLELTPDTQYIPYLYETYLRLSKEHFGHKPDYREGMPAKVYFTGFVTSMHDWIQLLYLEGGERNLELAENYFAWLRKNNPHPDGSTQERYLQTLDDFVMGEILSRLETFKAARAIVGNLVQRALKQFSLGLMQPAVQSLLRARQAYEFWMNDTRGDFNERRKMQPLVIIVRDEIEAFVKNPLIAPLYKATLWENLPLEQRRLSYDHLKPYFDRLCEEQSPPWDGSVAFPQPPGMEEFRKKELEYRGEPRREGVEEGERYKP